MKEVADNSSLKIKEAVNELIHQISLFADGAATNVRDHIFSLPR